MNPLRVTATNYRTFEHLDIEIAEGPIAIVGDNGSGKSSIVNLVDVCLFGADTRSLGDLLTRGGADTELMVALRFEHAGDVYRVRRSFSARGRGQTKVDLERRVPDTDEDDCGWEPLTAESAKATQETLERIIGLTRETFRASSFLAQGDGGSWTEAQPRDRKRILADVLGLSRWDRRTEAIRRDRRVAENRAALALGRIGVLEGQAGDPAELQAERENVSVTLSWRAKSIGATEIEVDRLTKAIEAVRARQAERAAAAERVTAVELQLDAKRQILARAREAEDVAVECRAVIERLGPLTSNQSAAERQLAEARSAADTYAVEEAARAAKRVEVERRRAHVVKREEEADRLSDKAQGLLANADALEATSRPELTSTCDRCGQALDDEARARAVESYRAEAAVLQISAIDIRETATAERHAINALHREATRADRHVTVPDPARLASLEQAVEEARAADRELAVRRERLAAAEQIALHASDDVHTAAARLTDELADAHTALASFENDEPVSVPELENRAATVKHDLAVQRRALDTHRADLARLDEQIAQAARVAQDLEAARKDREEAQAETDLLLDLERICGPNGIPVFIVETSAIPSIETEATALLAELGGPVTRVELRTQAAQKTTENLRETLDVICLTDDGEAAYETLSGGERTRVNLALRIALARLLAHRRGAESKILAIDEPEALDEAGTHALADVLRGLAARGDFDRIVLVSHVPSLRDAFGQSIEVVKEDGRSRILGAAA